MDLTPTQRRTLIALACKVAWADGIVTEEERDYVLGMVTRFAKGVLDSGEVEEWLDNGAPELGSVELPQVVSSIFLLDAIKIMKADGEVDGDEHQQLDRIMEQVFQRRRVIELPKVGG